MEVLVVVLRDGKKAIYSRCLRYIKLIMARGDFIQIVIRKVNRFFFERLVEELFFGVPLTDEHMTMAEEIIFRIYKKHI